MKKQITLVGYVEVLIRHKHTVAQKECPCLSMIFPKRATFRFFLTRFLEIDDEIHITEILNGTVS